MLPLLAGWLAQVKNQDLLLLEELVIEEVEKRLTKRNDLRVVCINS
jgi:hypothetical protein